MEELGSWVSAECGRCQAEYATFEALLRIDRSFHCTGLACGREGRDEIEKKGLANGERSVGAAVSALPSRKDFSGLHLARLAKDA
jgi:hypothetical protein